MRKRIYLLKSEKDSFAKLIYESVTRPTNKIDEILSKKVKKNAGYISISLQNTLICKKDLIYRDLREVYFFRP